LFCLFGFFFRSIFSFIYKKWRPQIWFVEVVIHRMLNYFTFVLVKTAQEQQSVPFLLTAYKHSDRTILVQNKQLSRKINF
jgi:hypothetical protein